MKKLFLLGLLTGFSTNLYAANGVVQVKSQRTFDQTQTALRDAIQSSGLTIFEVVDHKENGEGVGIDIQPSVVFIFGNPKIGSKLMQCQPSVAIDLPQKIHILEDKNGDVSLSYNDPEYLKSRHNLVGCDKLIPKIQGVLERLSHTAGGL